MDYSNQDPLCPRKVKTRFTYDLTQNPNRLSRFFMSKTNVLDPNPGKKKINFLLLSFLIPFIGLGLSYLFLAIIMSVQPSSHEGFRQSFSMLHSDAYHQYFPFFKAFRQNILSGHSLLYSWEVGMGVDYIGLYAYYLGSPLNWISLILPESWLLPYFTLLTPVRLGLASLFFSLMLKKLFDRDDLSIALFGSFYATCAWSFGYMWNTMWLDTFALLPLVILGTVSVLKDRKFILYTVSLFLSVVINYYVGFFTCIFTLLVFICFQVCNWRSLRRFLADLMLMGLFTILAIGATAVITLPTFASLMTTSASESMTSEASAFVLNMTDMESERGFADPKNFLALFQGMATVATNAFAFQMPNFISDEGIPNIYCGVFAVMLSLMFITCKQVSKRERICWILVLLFLNVSFVIDKLNFIWHGFHTTNMIPYRFSFIYSFVMLYAAFRAWHLRRRFQSWQVIAAGAAAIVALLLSDGFRSFIKGPFSLQMLLQPNFYFPFVNLFFIAAYFAALYCTVKRTAISPDASWAEKRTWYKKLHFRRSLGSFALVCVLCLELFINLAFNAVTTKLIVDVANYPLEGKDTAAVLEQADPQTPFYRTEMTQYHILNDSSLIGYNGITAFTSSANSSITTFMRKLGYGAAETWNRYAYSANSPICDMFLNLKYQIDRDGYLQENPYFTTVATSGKVSLLENNYYLPLGFMVDPGLADFDITASNAGNNYTFHKNFLSAAMGKNVTPYTSLEGYAEVTADDTVHFNEEYQNNVKSRKFSTTGSGKIIYKYTIPSEGYMCAAFQFFGKDFTPKYKAYLKQGDTISQTPVFNLKYSLSNIQAIGQVHPGDQVVIVVECGGPLSNCTSTVIPALLDQAVVDEAYQQFSQSTLQVTKFEDTLIEGTIHCQTAGLMYTSVPQNGSNWHVYVDGKEADITLIGGVMIGVMLPEGTHNITFRYENNAFRMGLAVSIACTVLFLGICTLVIFRKKKKQIQ